MLDIAFTCRLSRQGNERSFGKTLYFPPTRNLVEAIGDDFFGFAMGLRIAVVCIDEPCLSDAVLIDAFEKKLEGKPHIGHIDITRQFRISVNSESFRELINFFLNIVENTEDVLEVSKLALSFSDHGRTNMLWGGDFSEEISNVLRLRNDRSCVHVVLLAPASFFNHISEGEYKLPFQVCRVVYGEPMTDRSLAYQNIVTWLMESIKDLDLLEEDGKEMISKLNPIYESISYMSGAALMMVFEKVKSGMSVDELYEELKVSGEERQGDGPSFALFSRHNVSMQIETKTKGGFDR